MKRWFLRLFVLALVFVLGGYGGSVWQAWDRNKRQSPVYHDASLNAHPAEPLVGRFASPDPAVGDPMVDADVRFASNQFASNQFAEVASEPATNAQRFTQPAVPVPIQVADRFVQSNAPASPPTYEHEQVARFNESSRNQLRQSDFPPAVQSWAGGEATIPAQPSSAPAARPVEGETRVDLTEGMSYLIRVDRKDKTTSQKIRIQRMYGGKQAVLVDLAQQHTLPELRVFAEEVEVVSGEGEFELKCEGRVAVVANQSMLWGNGLSLQNGVFKISEGEVVTPDSVIKSGSCEFEFAVGGISVERINGKEVIGRNQEPPVAADATRPEPPPRRQGPEGTEFVPQEAGPGTFTPTEFPSDARPAL